MSKRQWNNPVDYIARGLALGASELIEAIAPATTFNQSRQQRIMYDTFDRTGLLFGSTANTGEVWTTSGGPGYLTAFIDEDGCVKNDGTANGNFYNTIILGEEFEYVWFQFSYYETGSPTASVKGTGVTLIAQGAPFNLSEMLHLQCTIDRGSMGIWHNGGITGIVGGTFDYEIQTDGQGYYVGAFQIDRANSRCRIYVPYGRSSGWISHPWIAELPPLTAVTIQETGTPAENCYYRGKIHAVGVGRPIAGSAAMISGAGHVSDDGVFRGEQVTTRYKIKRTISTDGWHRFMIERGISSFALDGRFRVTAVGGGVHVVGEWIIVAANNSVPTLTQVWAQKGGNALTQIRASTGSSTCALDLNFPTAGTDPVDVIFEFEGIGTKANFGYPTSGAVALTNVSELTIINAAATDTMVGTANTADWYTIAILGGAAFPAVYAEFEITAQSTGLSYMGTARVTVSQWAGETIEGQEPQILEWDGNNPMAFTQIRTTRLASSALRVDIYTDRPAVQPVTFTIKKRGWAAFPTFGVAAAPLATQTVTITPKRRRINARMHLRGPSSVEVDFPTFVDGGTYNMSTTTMCVHSKHTATLATYTVVLPTGVELGDRKTIAFRAPVTALIVISATGSVVGTPAGVTAGQSITYVWDTSINTWHAEL